MSAATQFDLKKHGLPRRCLGKHVFVLPLQTSDALQSALKKHGPPSDCGGKQAFVLPLHISPDARPDRKLARLAYRVVRLDAELVLERPESAVAAIIAALAERR